MTPNERAQLEAALVPHFAGATANGIAWLVGIVARLEECERRLAALEEESDAE
jgi:hypothetical protein